MVIAALHRRSYFEIDVPFLVYFDCSYMALSCGDPETMKAVQSSQSVPTMLVEPVMPAARHCPTVYDDIRQSSCTAMPCRVMPCHAMLT